MKILQAAAVNYYAIFTIVGLLLSVAVLFYIVRKIGSWTDDYIYCGIWAAVGAFIGAHILFFLVSLPDFIADLNANPPIDLGDFFSRVYNAGSGLVFYGGLLGALLAIFIFTKKKYLSQRHYLNFFVVVFPLFHAVARVGCVFSGCCYGMEYHGFCAISYPESVVVHGINDHITDFTRFPVQPLESVCELIIFFILISQYLKKGDAISVTSLYLLLYACVRFLDEFLRGDEYRGIWGPFSTSQWISLAIIVSVLIYWMTRRKRDPSFI